jgi:nucleoside-triphosphatase
MGPIFVLTGAPGVGKSTVVSKVLVRLRSRGVIVGGCLSIERRAHGQRVGFAVRDLSTGVEGELASAKGSLGPRVGRYRVNLTDLAAVGAKGLLDAASHSELIVIDEVGPMELVSPDFRRAVKACVASGRPIFAVLHERMQDDLLEEMKSQARYNEVVTLENRDSLPDDLAPRLLQALREVKKAGQAGESG